MQSRAHSTFLRTGAAFLAAVWLGAAPAAQERSLTGNTASVRSRSFGVERIDGELRGGGADYKAYFRAGGVEFHPALGREAPHNLPLTFQLQTVRRGTTLVHVADPSVVPEVDGSMIRYDRGPGLVERYEVRTDGVEQSFLFPEPLAGAGDLVVRGRVDTLLGLPARGEHTGGLAFELHDLGGVSIGAVTGVDAAGRTAPGSIRFDGEYLELVLPAELVDGAAYPLLLDPLIGTVVGVTTGSNDDYAPDVAYDASNDLYLVAWQRTFSISHAEVLGQRVTSGGAFSGGLITIQGADDRYAGRPTVASVNVSNRWLVVWQEGAILLSSPDLMGRSVNVTSAGGPSAIVAIADTTSAEYTPDAAGEPTLIDDDALVVWRNDDTGIQFKQVQVPADGAPPVPFGLVNLSENTNDNFPAISRCTNDEGNRLVVWQRYYEGTPADHDIRGTLISRNGVVLDFDKSIVTSIGPNEESPDVDGDGSSWFVAYHYEETLDVGPRDIRGLKVDWNGSYLVSGDEVILGGDDLDNDQFPAVAFTGPKYMVAWKDEEPTPDHYRLLVLGVNPDTCEVCENPVEVASGYELGNVEMASELSGSTAEGDDALVVWAEWDPGPPYDGDIFAQRLEAIGSGGSWSSLGGGCGGGGALSIDGPIAPGNPALTFDLLGADPAATVGLLLVRPPSPGHTFTCGSCTFLLPPGIMLSAPLVGGFGSVKVPVPCQGDLQGATFEAQWVSLVTSTSPCPLFSGISFSKRVTMTFAP